MLNNIIIPITCVLIDIDDVREQICAIVDDIYEDLLLDTFLPTSHIEYQKDGLTITFDEVDDLTQTCKTIVNNLEFHGWLGSVVNFELNDFGSNRSAILLPSSKILDDLNQLSKLFIPKNSQPFSNCVNFN